ncbi:DegT/DnrJ/EryC1/StrS family aminotransferase [Caenimonas sedimenti]|uniref:DegT/DnrJ/EryC1/StrS family aminotransferase n=2 Tax=Caenimonas sedimenti TaxID=2596921 RepID=A0A562ZH62_9BURK|nr:DegT/DnrJ/EryC1/StrS family aminotransferase [Caenimonas sedimenti]
MALDATLQRVLQRNWFVLGEEVREFEREFAAWCGVAHCVTVANGTDALELALRALDVQPGGEVLCAANAGFYASAAALAMGAVPGYVDVDDGTLTLSPAALRQALAARPSKPAAVVATHLYGQLADVEGIAAVCAEAGVPWIEDCAQAHGAERGGRKAGSFAPLACFSFYPTKNLGALGDGGAVTSPDARLADRVRALRQYGWSAKYHVSERGGRNSRLDELQAAVLRLKLGHLERQNAERRAIARRYSEAFEGLALRLPVSCGADNAVHLYVVRTAQRETLRAHLLARGVASDVHYPVPDHQQAVLAASRAGVRLPVTEAACASVLSLPCFPGMREEEVDTVIAAVRAFRGQEHGQEARAC